MRKSKLLTPVLFAAIIFTANFSFAQDEGCKLSCREETPQIIVDGEGRVVATPNKAEFIISIRAEEKKLDKAFAASAGKINSITKALKQFNVKEEDIRNLGYSYTPLYEGKPLFSSIKRPTSYEISYKLQIRVLELNKIGQILMELAEIPESNVSNLEFGSTKLEELKNEAFKKAAEDAKLKAVKLAEGAGAELGPVFKIESAANPIFRAQMVEGRPLNFFKESDGRVAPEIQAGNLEITASCRVIYKIKQ